MVGLLTLSWAWAENSLAILIGIINEKAGPIKGHAEPPLSLKNRIACLKVALRDISVLEPFQQEGRALAVRFKELGPRRHDIIHGAAWQLEQGAFESASVTVNAGQNVVKNHRFNQADLVVLTTEVAKLQDDMADYMLRVIEIFN